MSDRIGTQLHSIILVLICLGLAIGAWALLSEPAWERDGRAHRVKPTANSDTRANSSTTPAKKPRRSAYRIITDRPLFYADRQPVAATTDEPTVAEPEEPRARNYQLLGVVIDGESRSALLSFPGGATPELIAEGESIDGWRLTQIRDDTAILERGSSQQQLALVRTGSGKAPTANLKKRETKSKTRSQKRETKSKTRLQELREAIREEEEQEAEERAMKLLEEEERD